MRSNFAGSRARDKYVLLDDRITRSTQTSKMKWPLVLICFLLAHSCILGASHSGCQFPLRWNGRWFLSGNTGLVTVNGSVITSKGQCVESKGDKFLIKDTKEKCFRCIVMHEKHPNVLQYKESYCIVESPEPTLGSMCNRLTSDGSLYSLFRIGASPLACPIKGPLEFTYSQGEDVCKSPLSRVEACTQESRLLLRYQACADVQSSESVDVEMECLATWKEGSTPYLVARLHSDHKTNDEDSYRCFIYNQVSNKTWHMAQSADAACTGLSSLTEAAKTFNMTRNNVPEYCTYPSWVVAGKSWVTLDRTASSLLASPHNLTILDKNETRLVCHFAIPVVDDHHRHHALGSYRETQTMYIAKVTRDCENGYVCLMFHRRDEHVIEMQLSKWSQQPDDVCNSSTFNSHSTPYTTFITSDPMTKQCPYLGRYEIVSMINSYSTESAEDVLGIEGEQSIANVAEVQDVRMTSTPFPRRCHHGVRRLDIGCRTPDRMEFATSCRDEAFSEYLCHGTWLENDKAYLVASTDVARYCLVYSASATMTGGQELSVTGHLASCPRASHRHPVSWQVNLTSYAQCGEISSASSWTSGVSLMVLNVMVSCVLFVTYIAR